MSRFADLIAPELPAGITIPEALDRAWTWMEEQGWGAEKNGSYFLTPYAGRSQLGIVFSTGMSLQGWFRDPDDPALSRLMPLGETDTAGSMATLWLDASDTLRSALLGQDVGRLLLADDAVDFLRLVAIGYLELSSYDLVEEPYVEDDMDSVAALADFRAWVAAEFGVDVPAHWSVRSPDPFEAWVAQARGE